MAAFRSVLSSSVRATSVVRWGGLLFALLLACMIHAWINPAPSRALGSVHEIEILGHDHAWQVRYPGADAQLGTADDIVAPSGHPVHVPTGVPTRVVIHSDDYIYSLRIPTLGVNEVAIPGMEFELRLDAVDPGHYALEGGEMCGAPPAGLQGEVRVESERAYWSALDRMGRP